MRAGTHVSYPWSHSIDHDERCVPETGTPPASSATVVLSSASSDFDVRPRSRPRPTYNCPRTTHPRGLSRFLGAWGMDNGAPGALHEFRSEFLKSEQYLGITW